MRSFLFKFFLAAIFGLTVNLAQAQTLKLEELITSFNAPKYPATVFELIENKGFERIDKQWLANCDRAIYYLNKEGKPSLFVNPMNCFKMIRSAHYPAYYRNEMEVQFQKSARTEFEDLSAQVKKQCKALGTQQRSESGANVAGTKAAYRHEATGTTLVIEDSAAVAYIYFIK